MSLIYRPETAADLPAIRRLVSEAFGGDEVAALLDAMRHANGWLGLSFVAVDGDEIVGHVAFTRAWLDCRDALREVLVLSPLAVAPSWQRRGVGKGLVEWCCEELVSSPRRLIFLEGDPGYYAKLGFAPAEPLGYGRPSLRIPAPAFQVRAIGGSELPAGTLVYDQVFWEHDSVGLRDPLLKELEEGQGPD